MRKRTIFHVAGRSVAHIVAEGQGQDGNTTGFDDLHFVAACGQVIRVQFNERGHELGLTKATWDLDKLHPEGSYALTVESAWGTHQFTKVAPICKRCSHREIVKYDREEHCI
jgi:hypothetical protein